MLGAYNGAPFGIGTQIDEVDTFTGNGSQVAFDLVNKPVSSLAGIIQVQNTQADQLQGGFARTGSGFQLTAPPAAGAIVIAPGILRVTLTAYDQATITGLTNPNKFAAPVYLIDPTTIGDAFYQACFGNTGIYAVIGDLDTSYGASASWCQMGYAVPATGAAPSSWNATGVPLSLQNIGNFSTVAGSISSGAMSVTVADATQFDLSTTAIFAQFDYGLPTQEIVQVTAVNTGTNTLTITPTTYGHASGNFIYMCGVKVWILLTLPTSLGAKAYYDLSFNLDFDEISR